MIEKMFAKNNILKAVSIITSMLMVMSSFACIPSVNIEGKGNDIANANIVPKEEDNTGSGKDENIESTEPEKIDYPFDFSVKDKDSFAARVQGVYKIDYPGQIGEDEAIDEEVEIYAVGDNLYAMYSGYGFTGIELFPAGKEGFDSKTATSLEVYGMSFSIMSNFGYYQNNGVPSKLTMKIDGDDIVFSEAGDEYFELSGRTLKRINREMGYLANYDYKADQYNAKKLCKDANIDTIDTPATIIGGWMLLGDSRTAVSFEFTDDNLVQSYWKNDNEEVTLFRGTYAVSKNEEKGCYDILMNMMKFGYGSSPNEFKISFEWYDDKTDSMSVVTDDTPFGEDAVWGGAMLCRMDNPANVRTAGIDTSEEFLSRPRKYGYYYSDDGWTISFTGSDFVLFDSHNQEDATIWYVGHMTKGEKYTELYLEPDFGETEETYFGYLTEPDDDTVEIYEESSKKTRKYKLN
ncbi:MAG: hypothetical protein J6X45_03475 [Lachnospiraceae bacterium]|nr:hypothetical protein [Lachnospiraceae bacterium]MBP5564766.1 hypothetical protein [Lachnospiraceae bacterium]